jgi:hypothetical protein
MLYAFAVLAAVPLIAAIFWLAIKDDDWIEKDRELW